MSTIRRVVKPNPAQHSLPSQPVPQQAKPQPSPQHPDPQPSPNTSMATPASLPDYQLGEVLGRGAFGCVFRALNWCTGETVAVKQVGLGNIPRSELPEIMSEIDLLKNLDHPNIVQYRGFVKTSDYLYIILEYCENGSLHTICKKFGKFPESLVAVYICQVLEGLLYLHEQGVIHRDIKGSNILATKEGGVKLADFGVATRTGGLSDNAVVGSPYWMAPEVVDQSGATTASDIWSVGCVVIELLEGKPPYYFLDPMPALFRIVNDDCPPLPESASPIARDFLLQCFQKDQNLRISAKKLLKHPWMLSAKKRLEQKEREQALAQGRRTPAGHHQQNGSDHGHASSQSHRNLSKTGYDETVQRVQDWNKALESPTASIHPKAPHEAPYSPHFAIPSPNQHSPGTHRPNDQDARPRTISRNLFSNTGSIGPSKVVPALLNSFQEDSTLPKNLTIRGLGVGNPARNTPSTNLALSASSLPVAVISTTPPARKLAEVGVESSQGDSNWDDDFEGGISTSKIAALDEAHGNSGSSESDNDDDDDGASDDSGRTRRMNVNMNRDDNTATIKPTGVALKSNHHHHLNNNNKPAVNKNPELGPIVEDYSDLVGDDQRDPFEGKVASLKVLNQHQKILHPNDINGLPTSSAHVDSPSSHAGFKSRLGSITARSNSPAGSNRSDSPGPSMSRSTHLSSSNPHHHHPHHHGHHPGLMNRANTSSSSSGSHVTFNSNSSADSNLNRFSEDGGEDYSDLFGKNHPPHDDREAPTSGETLKLQTRLSNMSSKSWLGDEDSDEVDPFAEVEDENLTEEATLEANIARDRLARLSTLVTEIVDQMTPDIDEVSLKDGCMQLIGLFEDTPEIRTHFVRSHGMLAVIELLQQFRRSRDLVSLLLRTINLIINDDPESLEKICYNGGCPVVMGFASNKYAREIRLEAALFIGSMCQTSLLTLQMFISCRGLKVLVEMMDENYDEQKDLVWMAVDGICRVFELQGPTPRNDFCRMFAHEGLLEPLSEALLHVSHDDDDLAENAKGRIVHIFLLFSQADMKVKEIMLTRAIILRLIKSLSILDNELLATMLKTLKNLTMLPVGLQVLQNANAIETLTKVLKQQIERDPDTSLTTEIANHVVNALYNLCRLSKPRQEEAALAGAIPILQRVVKSSSPLKQFALPILCDFAHTSKTCRKLLWQKDGFAFYLGLLRDPFWGITALESILAWLSDETARVEDALTEPSSIEALLRMFTKAKATTFENLLDPLLKLFRISPSVGTALIGQPAFARRLVDRLVGHNKAVVRLNLLRLTKAVFETVADKSVVVRMPGLSTTIHKMVDSESAILVRELAKELHREFSAVLNSLANSSSTAARQAAAAQKSGVGSSISTRPLSHVGLPPRNHHPLLNSSSSSTTTTTSTSPQLHPNRPSNHHRRSVPSSEPLSSHQTSISHHSSLKSLAARQEADSRTPIMTRSSSTNTLINSNHSSTSIGHQTTNRPAAPTSTTPPTSSSGASSNPIFHRVMTRPSSFLNYHHQSHQQHPSQ